MLNWIKYLLDTIKEDMIEDYYCCLEALIRDGNTYHGCDTICSECIVLSDYLTIVRFE